MVGLLAADKSDNVARLLSNQFHFQAIQPLAIQTMTSYFTVEEEQVTGETTKESNPKTTGSSKSWREPTEADFEKWQAGKREGIPSGVRILYIHCVSDRFDRRITVAFYPTGKTEDGKDVVKYAASTYVRAFPPEQQVFHAWDMNGVKVKVFSEPYAPEITRWNRVRKGNRNTAVVRLWRKPCVAELECPLQYTNQLQDGSYGPVDRIKSEQHLRRLKKEFRRLLGSGASCECSSTSASCEKTSTKEGF
jgi:hypothetical protein